MQANMEIGEQLQYTKTRQQSSLRHNCPHSEHLASGPFNMSINSARTRKRALTGRSNVSEGVNSPQSARSLQLSTARSNASRDERNVMHTMESRGTQTTPFAMPSARRPFTAEDHSLTRRSPRPPLVKRWIKFDEQQQTRPFRCPPPAPAYANAPLDDERIEQMAKEFVSRNEHRLYAFNPAFFRMEPDEVIKQLTENKSKFAHRIWKLEEKERKLDLGTDSSRIKFCMDVPREPVGRVDDPCIASLTTSREQKTERLMRLFTPAYTERTTKYNRTKGTIPEYGNFSSFVDVINRIETLF